MKQLKITQLDSQLQKLKPLKQISIPKKGWIYNIRTTLNMSLKQLGCRIQMTPQGIKEIEERENNNTITINTLQKVANALDMKLVYALIPNDDTLEKLIDKRVKQIMKKILERTAITMDLEDQNSDLKQKEKLISQEIEEIKRKLPRYIWD